MALPFRFSGWWGDEFLLIGSLELSTFEERDSHERVPDISVAEVLNQALLQGHGRALEWFWRASGGPLARARPSSEVELVERIAREIAGARFGSLVLMRRKQRWDEPALVNLKPSEPPPPEVRHGRVDRM